MSQHPPELQKFVDDCVVEYCSGTYEEQVERSDAVAYVTLILVAEGLRVMLPELQEWLALGATAIALKRQEIEQKLMNYAKEKELDYTVAKKSAAIVAKRLDEKTLKTIVDALKKLIGMDKK